MLLFYLRFYEHSLFLSGAAAEQDSCDGGRSMDATL